MMRRCRSLRGATALWLLGLGACSLIEPSYTADGGGVDGHAPVEVTVEFAGNSGLGSTELRLPIEDYMFDLSRDPTRESAVYDAALELEDLYRSEGYPVAKVQYDYTPPAEGARWPERVAVRFRIEEGPRIRVRMALTGNQAFEKDELLQLWTRQRGNALGIGGDVFVAAQVYSFAEELRSYYRAHGRLDVGVDGPRIDVDLAAATAQVAIAIDEGHVHTIGAVELAGPLREALGADVPPPPTGRPWTRGELQGYRTALRNALRHRGHPNPAFSVRAEAADASGLVARVVVDGEPGPLVTIAAVGVAGNERTLTGVIRGKLDVAVDDAYDGDKVDDALQRLYQSGLFRKVDIHERPLADEPTRMVLDVQVEEGESRAIELLGGYGSYEQFRGGLRLEERNLFGTGRGIVLDNKLSQKGYATGVTVTDPDFLATGAVLTVNGERFRREEPSFTDEALGGTVALAQTLHPGLIARVGYSYRDRIDARAFTLLPQDQLVDYTEGKVFVELRNDRRDNLLFPKSGHTESLAFERIAPAFGATVDLDRLVFRAAAHIALFDRVQVVLRSEQSVLWPHEGSAQVPLQERWFAGGESSVRSFQESELGPKDADLLPVGGEYRNLLGAELRFPVWRLLEGSLFVDAGNVGSRVQDYSLRDLHYGIGAGLRLLLPIGPVRLDGAWNPDQDLGDESWVVHLSVGYPF